MDISILTIKFGEIYGLKVAMDTPRKAVGCSYVYKYLAT